MLPSCVGCGLQLGHVPSSCCKHLLPHFNQMSDRYLHTVGVDLVVRWCTRRRGAEGDEEESALAPAGGAEGRTGKNRWGIPSGGPFGFIRLIRPVQ